MAPVYNQVANFRKLVQRCLHFKSGLHSRLQRLGISCYMYGDGDERDAGFARRDLELLMCYSGFIRYLSDEAMFQPGVCRR